MRILFYLFLSGFLVGCSTKQAPDTSLDAWKGQTIKQVEDRMGKADEVVKLPDGHVSYVFTSELEDYSAHMSTLTFVGTHGKSYGVEVPSNMPPETSGFYGLRCTSWFETDAAGKIVKVKHEGEHCLREDALMFRSALD